MGWCAVAMILEIEDYFRDGCGRCGRFATDACAARRWSGGLAALRGICLGAGLVEAVKWGHPCYTFAGRNIAILGAFRSDFRISLFEAGLLEDPEGLLERQGPNSADADCLRFTSVGAVRAREAAIGVFLDQAKGHAVAGRRQARREGNPDLPEALLAALEDDPALAAAFHALTPGRQRGWALHVGGAKQQATRQARIARGRDAILAGRGFNER